MKIKEAKEMIEKLQNYVDVYEKYEPKNMKEMCIKLYAEWNSVSEVARILNEKGYRKEGKQRTQVKLTSNDVTKMLNSEVEDGDSLHPIVKRILNKNRRRKGIIG